ncbi:MAG: branched-chain amino acid ABC transporter permease [Burkholderiales bacterium]
MGAAQLVELAVGGLAIGCIYSLIALGMTMIIRATGIVHFAQGEIVMIGSVLGLSALLALHLPFIAVLVVGMLVAGIAAVAIELGIYRTLRARGTPLSNIIIATVGVSIVLQNIVQIAWGSEPKSYPRLFAADHYQFGAVKLSPQFIWVIVLGVVVMLALQAFLRYTRAGIAMQAAAQDPETAQLMGINLTKSTAYTFAIGGVLAGAAGVLLGSMFFASFSMGFLPGIKAFVAATLGGLGSIGGAMIGGILFGLLETFGAVWISTAYKDAIGMVLLIVILLVFPKGLAGLVQRGR